MDDKLMLSYLDSSRGYIRNDLNNLATHFLKLGFHLREVQNMKYYEAGGYSSVAEFAEVEFGIKKSNCYNYIKLCELYSQNHNSMFLDDIYKDYNYSQLVEMMSLPGDKFKLVRSDMTVRQIRELKKSPQVSSSSNDDVPVQTSGLDIDLVHDDESVSQIQVSPPGTFEEVYNEHNQKPLFDELMEILKNNIKNVDKVKALIEFLNEVV